MEKPSGILILSYDTGKSEAFTGLKSGATMRF
jgi:hypothetical protein